MRCRLSGSTCTPGAPPHGQLRAFSAEFRPPRRACWRARRALSVSARARGEDLWLQQRYREQIRAVKAYVYLYRCVRHRGKNEANVERAMPVILNKGVQPPGIAPQNAG